MSPKPERKVTFIDSLFGLLLEPGATTLRLFAQERPPYAMPLLLWVFLSIFAPIWLQVFYYGSHFYDLNVLVTLTLVAIFTAFFFVLVEGVFLLTVGIETTLPQLLAMIAYSLTPLSLVVAFIYGFDFATHQTISVIGFLLTGYVPDNDLFLKVVPIALLIANLWGLLVFYYSVRVVGQLEVLTAVNISILSAVPFYLSLLGALYVGELAQPGTMRTFLQFLTSTRTLLS